MPRVTDPIPEHESPGHRFFRLAEARRDRILKAIQVLENIGRNPHEYAWYDSEVHDIFSDIRARLDEAERVFYSHHTRARPNE